MPKPTKTATAVATPQPTEPIDWSQFGTVTGFDNVNQEDLGIPFFQILQKGSPEVDVSDPAYPQYGIEGAQAGDILNTVSRQIIHKVNKIPVEFIPCAFEKLFMEWKPRDSGGGLVKSHRDPAVLVECRRNDRNQDVLKNGNLIVTTCYFYGLYKVDDSWQQAVIGMSSTQQKKSRLWLNTMMGIRIPGPDGVKITPPMFSHRYGISTVPESNDKGSWMGWKIELLGGVSDKEVIADAAHIAKKVSQGTIRGSLPSSASTEVM